MSSVLSLSFTPTGYSAAGTWPLTSTPAKVTTTKLANAFSVAGLVTGATHAWKPAAAQPLTVDTAKNLAVFGEFALDVWIRDTRIVEPVTLVGGPGSPVELVLHPETFPEGFYATASIRSGGAPVVLRSGTLIADPADPQPVHLGVWVTGSEAVWVVQNRVAARVQLPASTPDARGKIAIGAVPKASTSGLTILGLWLRDQLDATQEAAVADAAAAGIGVIDAFVASSAGNLGAPTNAESAYGTVRTRSYQHGNVYWSPTTGAHDVRGTMLRAYESEGGHIGPLGLPTSQAMPLDAVLDYLNAPRVKGSSGITLGDILKEHGRLKASDFVVESAAKPRTKVAAKRRGWDAFATADHTGDEAERARITRPLDAEWVATALGHAENSPDLTRIFERRAPRRHGVEGIDIGIAPVRREPGSLRPLWGRPRSRMRRPRECSGFRRHAQRESRSRLPSRGPTLQPRRPCGTRLRSQQTRCPDCSVSSVLNWIRARSRWNRR